MNAVERAAWNIRRLRVERALSQEALALEAGIDRTYISRVERSLENPTVGLLERIARALDCDIAVLFDCPAAGSKTPAKLPSGRKPRQASRSVRR
ncbi:helix-turn-helix transcriptional regulator [Solimonas flava]|uniref:helix-turn-helix transcriptional regulator n=1 Tax=Solimonas flava TaxID=415849 RepID=UPI00048595C7|nr:helix-turn-helix transcriptional regulator [Solimonas flava]